MLVCRGDNQCPKDMGVNTPCVKEDDQRPVPFSTFLQTKQTNFNDTKVSEPSIISREGGSDQRSCTAPGNRIYRAGKPKKDVKILKGINRLFGGWQA